MRNPSWRHEERRLASPPPTRRAIAVRSAASCALRANRIPQPVSATAITSSCPAWMFSAWLVRAPDFESCESSKPRRPSPASVQASRSTSTAPRPRRRCCWTRSWRVPRISTTSAWSTSTARAPVRTWHPRWRRTSGIGRCSSGRTPGPPSTRVAPTMCRRSCRTYRACSTSASLPLDAVLRQRDATGQPRLLLAGHLRRGDARGDPGREDGDRPVQPVHAAHPR